MPLPFAAIFGTLLRSASSIGGAALRGGSRGLGSALRNAPAAGAQAASGPQVRPGLGAIMRGMLGRTGAPQIEPAAQYFRKRGIIRPSQDQIDAYANEQREKNRLPSLGDNLKAVGMQAGAATAGMASLTATTGLAVKGTTKLADALNRAATTELRQFNATIGALAARREVFEIQHSRRRGRAVEGTTKELGDTLMAVREMGQPYATLGENLLNRLQLGLVSLGGLFLEALERIGIKELVDRANRWFGGGKVDKGLLLNYLNRRMNRGAPGPPDPGAQRPPRP